MSWREFVTKTMGSDQQQVAAGRAGINPSTVSRWLSTGKPGDAENVAAFARAYGAPVLQAFLAAEFLTEEEAGVRPTAAPDLSQLTNDELLELVRARMSEEVVGNDRSAAPMKRTAKKAQPAKRVPSAKKPRPKRPLSAVRGNMDDAVAAFEKEMSTAGEQGHSEEP